MTGPASPGAAHPGVSVVIAAHDAAATIAEAIESVLGQSIPPLETIVVDDGSTDGTGQLVAERFPGVRVVTQANSGPSLARNLAVAQARGEWIAFLDADDVWHPDKLALQLGAAARHPGTVLVASDWVSSVADFVIEPDGARSHESVLSTRDMVLLNRFQTSTVLLSRGVAVATGGFDPSVDGTEDWDLWVRSSMLGTVVKVDRPLVCYRDLPGSYSKDGWRVYSSMLRLLDRHLVAAGLSGRELRRVRAWHELRFLVSFSKAGRPDLARRVVFDLRSEHLVGATPGAAVRHLLPFLARRRLKRLARRIRPARQGARRPPLLRSPRAAQASGAGQE